MAVSYIGGLYSFTDVPFLSPLDSFQGWEEVTDAALTHILRTTLAKSAKERAGTDGWQQLGSYFVVKFCVQEISTLSFFALP